MCEGGGHTNVEAAPDLGLNLLDGVLGGKAGVERALDAVLALVHVNVVLRREVRVTAAVSRWTEVRGGEKRVGERKLSGAGGGEVAEKKGDMGRGTRTG